MHTVAPISQRTGCGRDALHSQCAPLLVRELSAGNGIFLAWFPKETKLQQPCSVCQFPPSTFEWWLLLKTFFFFWLGRCSSKTSNAFKHQENRRQRRGRNPSPPKAMEVLPPHCQALLPSKTPCAVEALWMFIPCWSQDSPTTTRDAWLHQPQSSQAGMESGMASTPWLLPLPWHNRVATVRRRHPSCMGKAKQEE